MSFLKITDPLKREQMVKEYLATMKRIRDNQLAERTGEIELQTDLSKFFKPITETQKASTKEITEGLKPIKEGIEQLPKELPQPSLSFPEEEYDGLTLLDKKYNKMLSINKGKMDETFGIKKDEKNNYFIGDKMIDYDGEYITIIGGKRYKSTDGLWKLITSKNLPSREEYNENDEVMYDEILKSTNVMHRDNKPSSPYPKSNKGEKWEKLIGPLWRSVKKSREYKGDGITFIPSNPNSLLERLDLLMASKKAGNTGVRNELVSICDELKRQHVLNTKSYKKLMSIL